MKVSQRRNRLILVYALLLFFFVALGRIASATEAAAGSAKHQSKFQVPSAVPNRAGGHQFDRQTVGPAEP